MISAKFGVFGLFSVAAILAGFKVVSDELPG